jgi:predicted esterase
MLFWRCTESPAVSPAAFSDGRLHVTTNPSVNRPPGGGTTVEPKPLGLASDRDGFFYVPSRYVSSSPAPLLLYLHGATGTGQRGIQRWIEIAEQTATIVVAPDSRSSTWGVVSGDEAADVAFLDLALERILSMYSLDAHRMYVSGFSDGASAALSLGLVNGDLFAAIAAFSPGFVQLSSPPNGRPRVFISHGENDSVLPVERCGRRIARELRDAGYTVEYQEFDGDHELPPAIRGAGLQWLLSSGMRRET